MFNPGQIAIPDPPVLNPSMVLSDAYLTCAASAASSAWTANLAMYYPVVLGQKHTYKMAFWITGATATGNVDIGMYDSSLNKIASTGAVSLGTVSTINTNDIADFDAGPGLVYLAVSCSSSSGTLWAFQSTGIVLRAKGVFQQSTAHPLPSSATFAACTTARMPVFGFSEQSVV